MIYLELFIIFFKIGSFSFGGGLPMLSLIERELISRNWITSSDFLDLVSIVQVTPGAIAVNSATYAGNKVAGFSGGLVATLGVITPSIIIIIIISGILIKFRENKTKDKIFMGINPVTIALIAYAGYLISSGTFVSDRSIDISATLIGVITFILFLKTKVNPVFIFSLSAIMGVVLL